MILVKMTHGSNIYYISDVGIAYDDKFWYPKLSTLSSVQMRPDKEYGGMVRIQGYGTLSVIPDTLPWPIEIKFNVEVKYLNEDKIATDLFTAVAYLKSISMDGVTFNLYNDDHEADMLDEAPNWPSNFTAEQTGRFYPLVLGTVSMVQPIRVGVHTEYKYHCAGITDELKVYDDGRIKNTFNETDGTGTVIHSSSKSIEKITVINGGTGYSTGTISIVGDSTGTGFSANYSSTGGSIDYILITKVGNNYTGNGTLAVSDSSGSGSGYIGTYTVYSDKRITAIDIVDGGTTYTAGTLSIVGDSTGSLFAGTYTVDGGVIDSVTITNPGSGYTGDGILTPSNAGDGGFSGRYFTDDNTFKSILASNGSLENRPYGNLLINGKNANITTLKDLFTWAVARFSDKVGVTYTLDVSVARDPSPDICFYLDTQTSILDFLSEASAFFTHCFYIDEVNHIFYLIDMKQDNGTMDLSLGENNEVTLFFDSKYEYKDPIKKIECTWQYSYNDYDKDGYSIFVEDEYYKEFTSTHKFGKEESIETFVQSQTSSDTDKSVFLNKTSNAINNIAEILNSVTVELSIPYDLDNVVPGKRYDFQDSSTYFEGTVSLRTHTIEYNPIDMSTKIIGILVRPT